MDEENDLSSGELFAAKVTQDGTTNIEETGFDVEWISMGHANNSIISSWIDEYDHITRDDFRGDGNSYITDEEIRPRSYDGAAGCHCRHPVSHHHLRLWLDRLYCTRSDLRLHVTDVPDDLRTGTERRG